MDLGLKGRRAIVCASSKGLGRACAFALAREGVDLVINSRGAEALAETAREIEGETGARVTPVACDITSETGRAEVLAACPDPDILVNNAGGPPPGDFRDWEREHWVDALDANMLTPIFLIKAVVDGMIDRGFGRIVNISSLNGEKGQFGQANYSAAKAGIYGFTKAIAQEGARKGVTVNAVSPGYIDTPMVRQVPENVLNSIVEGIPVGRLGQPEEIARAVAFLTAEDAGFITGTNLSVNGGQYMS